MNRIEKSAKRWAKPELTKLGTLRDVTGHEAVNSNSRSGGFRSNS